MLSASCFNFDQSKILSSGNGIDDKFAINQVLTIYDTTMIFVDPTYGEQYIVVTATIRCTGMFLRLCVGPNLSVP